MAIFKEFPYTNYHELNLDWVINEIKVAKVNNDKIVDLIANLDDKISNIVIAIMNQWLIDGTIQGIVAEVNSENFINVKVPPSPLTACKGDGVTDDTTALQGIIDYALNNGKDIYFPSGTYLSGHLSINKTGGKLVMFSFDGENTIIKSTASAPSLMEIGSLSAFHLEGLTIEPIGNTQLIDFTNGLADNIYINKCNIKNTGSYVITLNCMNGIITDSIINYVMAYGNIHFTDCRINMLYGYDASCVYTSCEINTVDNASGGIYNGCKITTAPTGLNRIDTDEIRTDKIDANDVTATNCTVTNLNTVGITNSGTVDTDTIDANTGDIDSLTTDYMTTNGITGSTATFSTLTAVTGDITTVDIGTADISTKIDISTATKEMGADESIAIGRGIPVLLNGVSAHILTDVNPSTLSGLPFVNASDFNILPSNTATANDSGWANLCNTLSGSACVIYFGSGLYKFSTGITLEEGFNIVGNGTKFNKAVNLVDYCSITGCVLSNALTINGSDCFVYHNRFIEGSVILYASASGRDDAIISENEFIHTQSTGAFITTSNAINGCLIKDNIMIDTANGVKGISVTPTTGTVARLSIIGNTIKGTNQPVCMDFTAPSKFTDMVIEGNKLFPNQLANADGKGCIHIHSNGADSNGLHIKNNIIRDSGADGLDIRQTDANYNIANVIITGNHLQGMGENNALTNANTLARLNGLVFNDNIIKPVVDMTGKDRTVLIHNCNKGIVMGNVCHKNGATNGIASSGGDVTVNASYNITY